MSSIQNYKHSLQQILEGDSLRDKKEATSIFFQLVRKLVDEIKEEGAEIGNIRSLTKQIKKEKKNSNDEELVEELRDRLDQAKKDKWSFGEKNQLLSSLTSQQKDLLRVLRRKK